MATWAVTCLDSVTHQSLEFFCGSSAEAERQVWILNHHGTVENPMICKYENIKIVQILNAHEQAEVDAIRAETARIQAEMYQPVKKGRAKLTDQEKLSRLVARLGYEDMTDANQAKTLQASPYFLVVMTPEHEIIGFRDSKHAWRVLRNDRKRQLAALKYQQAMQVWSEGGEIPLDDQGHKMECSVCHIPLKYSEYGYSPDGPVYCATHGQEQYRNMVLQAQGLPPVPFSGMIQ